VTATGRDSARAAFGVEIDADGNVQVSGVIDIETGDALAYVVRAALSRADGSLVVDMSSVEFMDSSGLGVLLSLQAECARRGIELRVADPSPAVRRLAEITGLAGPLGADEPPDQ